MTRRCAWRGRPWLLALLALGTGCGPESTTATITAIEPVDADDCGCDWITGEDGVVRVEHPLFGCVPMSDLVEITVELGPMGDGRRHEYRYPYGTEVWGTPRSVVAGLGVGSSFPATHQVSHGFYAVNGPSTFIDIPALRARIRAAVPPVRYACSGAAIRDDGE